MSATTFLLPAVSPARPAPSRAARMQRWLAACLRELPWGADAALEARRELAIEFSELSRGYPVSQPTPRCY